MERTTMMGLSEAAETVGISKSALMREVKAGRLPAARNKSGRYMINPTDLASVYPAAIEAAPKLYRISSSELDRSLRAAALRAELDALTRVLAKLGQIASRPSARTGI